MLNERMTVAQIVLDHSEAAPVFTRHRIDYCCRGELPLADACAERGADPKQLLAELEAAIDGRRGGVTVDPRQVPTDALVEHIVGRHHRYLREALPFLVPLAKKVARVHGAHNGHLLELRDAVEELSDALLPHLEREEQVLFPALMKDVANDLGAADLVAAEFGTMHADHLEVAKLLERVRASAEDFTVPEWGCTSYRTLFRELEVLEADVFAHVHLENHALMPRFTSPAEARS